MNDNQTLQEITYGLSFFRSKPASKFRQLDWVQPISADPTPEDESTRIVNRALDAGINLIDTGNSYASGESERYIGAALAANGRRHEVILSTKAFYKVGPGPNDEGLSRLHLIRACEDSLRRLQTDYIDLYQMHRPSPNIPLDETLARARRSRAPG